MLIKNKFSSCPVTHPGVERAVGQMQRQMRRVVSFDLCEVQHLLVISADNSQDFSNSLAQEVIERLMKIQPEDAV